MKPKQFGRVFFVGLFCIALFGISLSTNESELDRILGAILFGQTVVLSLIILFAPKEKRRRRR